jgi:hypothetical protein
LRASASAASTAEASAPSPTTFATQLYRIYLPLAFGEEPATASARRLKAERERQFHSHYLTPRFTADLARIGEQTDADPISLSQDWDASWTTQMNARLLSRSANKAAVLMSFGPPAEHPHQLVAHLTLVADQWRLDAVTMSPAELASIGANAKPSSVDFGQWTYPRTVTALTNWGVRREGDFVWSLTELHRCQFRERFASNLTTGDHHAFSQDTIFNGGALTPARMAVQQNHMMFDCRNGTSCGTLGYSDGRAPVRPSNGVDIYFQDGRGPDVIGAIKRLSEAAAKLCEPASPHRDPCRLAYFPDAISRTPSPA